ncbi:MAG: CocE/NonD family hydrolase, partial [Pirellulaceae bacterium]
MTRRFVDGKSLWNDAFTFMLAATCTMLVASVCQAQQATTDSATDEDKEKVSRFGEYSGYSDARFDEWVCNSQYIEMRDGVKLAIDVVRPTVDGVPVDEQLPVVWTHSRYHRGPQALASRFGMQGDINSMVDANPDLQRLVKHGYVVAAVGVRGSGASYGKYTGLFSPEETRDAFEIIQWLADQPWCDGNVGMHGASYLGMTQYMAASQAPPALKAIFPNVAGFDLYDVIYPGGVYREDMIRHWDELTEQLDNELLAPQVDTDKDGKMLEQAVAEHEENWEVAVNYRNARFRDSMSDGYSYHTHNPAPWLEQINEAKVPAYHWCGWDDVFVTDSLIWYANYQGPQKLAIGSWPHSGTPDPRIMMQRIRLRSAEQHRWFDFWLKGIDNGVMDQPPINISTLDDPGEAEWNSAGQWPLENTKMLNMRFAAGPSGSIESVNDGTLVLAEYLDKPQASGESSDQYAIDLETTSGSASRWDNAVGAGVMNYGDRSDNDKRCLTYTTEPLPADVNVTGHPVATLYVESTASDGDFYVLLEEVDEGG